MGIKHPSALGVEEVKKGYHIFQFVRNNGKVFGSSPKDGVPVVMTHQRLNPTARKIVRELQALGKEFLQLCKV